MVETHVNLYCTVVIMTSWRQVPDVVNHVLDHCGRLNYKDYSTTAYSSTQYRRVQLGYTDIV